MREKDKLGWVGTGNWYIHSRGMSVSGTEPFWRNKELTPHEVLTKWQEHHDGEPVDAVSWNEWKKQRRRINLVEVARYPATPPLVYGS